MIVIRAIEVRCGRGGSTRHLHHRAYLTGGSACSAPCQMAHGWVGSLMGMKQVRHTKWIEKRDQVSQPLNADSLLNANDNSPVMALRLAA